MNGLVLIGGGGHCKSVLDAALAMRCFDEIVITDSDAASGSSIFGCRVVGSDALLPTLQAEGFENAFVAVGSIQSAALRKKLAQTAAALGFRFPAICDPSATISEHAVIGEGAFIGKRAVVNAGAAVGEHCIINTGAILEHCCTVGAFTHVSVGAVLCGDICVGMESFLGAGSTVIQGVRIGDRVIVGANSTVLCNVPDAVTVYGIVRGRTIGAS